MILAWVLGSLALLVALVCTILAIREATEPRTFAHWHRQLRRQQRKRN